MQTVLLAQDATGAGLIGGLLLVAFVLGLYFLPTIVGGVRKVPNIGPIFVINFFLAWTVIGWVVAMAMAARSVPPSDN